MSKCKHGNDIDLYCAECDQDSVLAKIDENNGKVVMPKEDLEEFTWGQLFHFAKDSQSSNVYQQKRIENLEAALAESTKRLEKACSVLERANAISDSQDALIKRLTTSQ